MLITINKIRRNKDLTFQGLPITVESIKGSFRHGPDWIQKMEHDYGYIDGVLGADGDELDCFIGPNEDSGKIFIVEQNKPNGEFDEHKIMLGFSNISEAKDAYLANYPDDWDGFRNIEEIESKDFWQHFHYEGEINKENKMKIRINSKDEVQWITAGGRHIPIKKGESKSEAVKKAFEKSSPKTEKKSEGKGFYVDTPWAGGTHVSASELHDLGEKEFKSPQEAKKALDSLLKKYPNLEKKMKSSGYSSSEDVIKSSEHPSKPVNWGRKNSMQTLTPAQSYNFNYQTSGDMLKRGNHHYGSEKKNKCECPDCYGGGRLGLFNCKSCNGTGKILKNAIDAGALKKMQVDDNKNPSKGGFTKATEGCETCKGLGYLKGKMCKDCSGTGMEMSS